jgi:hypothetical protein
MIGVLTIIPIEEERSLEILEMEPDKEEMLTIDSFK